MSKKQFKNTFASCILASVVQCVTHCLFKSVENVFSCHLLSARSGSGCVISREMLSYKWICRVMLTRDVSHLKTAQQLCQGKRLEKTKNTDEGVLIMVIAKLPKLRFAEVCRMAA